MLDEILRLYVEENMSARDIIAHGFDEKTVRWVQRRVDINEYKREQAAPGPQGHQPRLRRRPPDADRAAVRRLTILEHAHDGKRLVTSIEFQQSVAASQPGTV